MFRLFIDACGLTRAQPLARQTARRTGVSRIRWKVEGGPAKAGTTNGGLATDATADVTIECFAPSWIAADAVWVKRNGETMPHVHEGGFVKIRGRFEKGDVLEFHLPVRTFAQDTINALSLPGYHTLRHGPMILARAGKEELAVARDARLVREAETAFRVAGTDVVLTPIHSRFDLTKEDSYLQVLFRD